MLRTRRLPDDRRRREPLDDGERGFARGFESYDRRREERGNGLKPRPPVGETLLERALAAVDARYAEPGAQERAPLFLYFHSFDPHTPNREDPESPLAADDALPLAPSGWHAERLREAGPDPPGDDPAWSRALEKLRAERGYYDQEVLYSDRVLGALVDGLHARGFLADGVVAVVSDHGEGLWDHVASRPPATLADSRPAEFFYQRHGAHLYQEAIATPFLLFGSRVPRRGAIEAAVENVDLFPTLLELAEVPLAPSAGAAQELHGRSLVPLLRGGALPERPYVFAHLTHKAQVRETATGLKLTRLLRDDFADRHENELVHLPSDPYERTNLYAERPEDVARLEARLTEWLAEHPPIGEAGAVDEEQAAELRGLGYTDEDIGR